MATLTSNKNYLSRGQYVVTINKTRYPNIEYFCNSLTIPGINVSPVEATYANNQFSESGNVVEYSELSMNFIIDEDMKNYFEIYNWLIRNAKENDKTEKSDMIITFLTSHSNSNHQIKFIDAFPISISDIELNSTNTNVEYIQGNASFRYSYFNLL